MNSYTTGLKDSRNRGMISNSCALSEIMKDIVTADVGVIANAIIGLLLNMRFLETSILSLGPCTRYVLDVLGMQR